MTYMPIVLHIMLCRFTSCSLVAAVSCGDMSCRTWYTSECRLMDATSAAVIPSCLVRKRNVIYTVFTTACTLPYFVLDTSIRAVVQQSKNCIKITSLAGKHESGESCVLSRKAVSNKIIFAHISKSLVG